MLEEATKNALHIAIAAHGASDSEWLGAVSVSLCIAAAAIFTMLLRSYNTGHI